MTSLAKELTYPVARYRKALNTGDLLAAAATKIELADFVLANYLAILQALETAEQPAHAQSDNVPGGAA